MEQNPTLIRSYRGVFALDRRIHRLDRWRLPMPYGLPLRGVGYGAVALAVIMLLGRLPLTAELLGILHPSLRFVALPVGVAWLLMQLIIDGRSPVAAGVGLVRLLTTPRRLAAFRRADALGPAYLDSARIAADESWARYRCGTVRGPAEVHVRAPAELTLRGSTVRLSPRGSRTARSGGKRVRLRAGQRMVIEA